MAAGTRANMAFGRIKIAQLARLLQAARQRLQQSSQMLRSLSVLFLFLPRAVIASSQELRRRLQRAVLQLKLSLSQMAPRLLLLRQQLRQSLSECLKALLTFLRRLRQVLKLSLSRARQQVLRLLHQSKSLVESFIARVRRQLQSLRSVLSAKLSGKHNQAQAQTTKNNPPPAQPGNGQREE